MPKDTSHNNRKRRQRRAIDANAEIRHHLEQCAVHLQAARVLMDEDSKSFRLCIQIGTRLKQIHRAHGGTQ
jgi:hypothetical protein